MKQQPEIIQRTEIASGKFLNLSVLTYIDDRGRTRKWEAAGRTNSNGAVMIVARVLPEDAVILVRQFRPPAGKYLIEFPAGLVDKENETIEDVAVRELSEETGYSGKIVKVLPPGYSSPGLSGETIATVVMEVDGNYFREHPPVAHPEDSESIECLVVPRAKLEDFLKRAIERGDGVDTKILIYAALN